MAFFEELQTQTEPARQSLYQIPILRAGVSGQINLDIYLAFLTQAYHHVKHTVPLLMACGSRLPEHLYWMQQPITQYIEEEKGHEQWILNDIKACGSDAEAVRIGQASLATEVMVAYAYDSIARKNPICFFGMVYVLEGTSTTLATQGADNIQKNLNLPADAFSYLSSHGAIDIEHMSFFEKLMNRLEAEADKKAVIHCANIMYTLYGNIFRTIGQQYGITQ
ncbi:MAG: iron-containing redox enzyme family protein [Thiotrichaceae bacterium]|nr:iron-containing redox enzyme family protein [Thiotrichaceae bacterium]